MKANIKGAIIYDCYAMNIEKEADEMCTRDKILCGIIKPLARYFRQRWKMET